MTAQSYVIRADHVRVAVDTANDDDRRRLLDILELVGELDELERTLPDRVAAAQATAEEPPLSLSKSAMEAASQSDDAAREIDRLLKAQDQTPVRLFE